MISLSHHQRCRFHHTNIMLYCAIYRNFIETGRGYIMQPHGLDHPTHRPRMLETGSSADVVDMKRPGICHIISPQTPVNKAHLELSIYLINKHVCTYKGIPWLLTCPISYPLIHLIFSQFHTPESLAAFISNLFSHLHLILMYRTVMCVSLTLCLIILST